MVSREREIALEHRTKNGMVCKGSCAPIPCLQENVAGSFSWFGAVPPDTWGSQCDLSGFPGHWAGSWKTETIPGQTEEGVALKQWRPSPQPPGARSLQQMFATPSTPWQLFGVTWLVGASG